MQVEHPTRERDYDEQENEDANAPERFFSDEIRAHYRLRRCFDLFFFTLRRRHRVALRRCCYLFLYLPRHMNNHETINFCRACLLKVVIGKR
jgi:hypothetical protein